MNRKTKQLLVALISALLVGVLGLTKTDAKAITSFFDQNQPGFYTVVRVEDGDTITVRAFGQEERVRMIGVDTPEKNHPEKPVQCFAEAASKFTDNLITAPEVRLVADPEDDNRDIYGRLLRYVYLPDGTLVNQRIIEDGYGFAYTRFPFTKRDEFIASERIAREQQRGLWRDCWITEQGGQSETNAL